MDSSVQQELADIHDEMNHVSAVIERVQGRIQEVTRRTDAQTDSWKNTMSNLGKERDTAMNEMRRLQHENAELVRKSSQRGPEIRNAIDARDAAVRKLRYTRKVVRDLVHENDKLRTGDGPLEAENRQDLRNALIEAMDEATPDTGSERTARPKRRSRGATAPKTSPHGKSSASSVAELLSPLSKVSADSSDLSVHPGSPMSRTGPAPGMPWSIHNSRPPKTAKVRFGPVSYERLRERLGFGDEAIAALERLQKSDDLCLHLHATGQCAFVYDPIFLEAPSRTYIIDWGTGATNQSLENFIAEGEGPLHTFTFPLAMGKWFYIGAHKWKAVKVWTVWRTLSPKSREKLVGKLSERSQGEFDKETITRALDDGGLQQLCVEISSEDHVQLSRTFSRQMGYEYPETT